MFRQLLAVSALGVCLILTGCGPKESSKPSTKTIPLDVLQDKIRGGWAGQMIGVSFGAPTEFKYLQKTIEGPLPEWNAERVKNSIHQDDLYVDMTLAQVLDDHGLDATVEQVGAMFRDVKYPLWHANLAARRNLKRGVPATLSGTPKYNSHANDIDFQIEADFVGLMTPGMPQASNDLCYRFGRVMNHGDGILGGMFVSAMYSAAFFESDPRKLVEAGLAAIPSDSDYAKVIADVLRWHQENPGDWKWNWQKIQDTWDKDEPCPSGAMLPFNIDAKLNGAYIALGMLYGEGDMGKTLDISTRAGQDSDCNPASAAGVLGVVLGYKAIPEEWKQGIDAIANEKFAFTNYTLNEIVTSSEKRAIAMATKLGGKQKGNELEIPIQEAKPMAIEMWNDYGKPAERVSVKDPRWSYTGKWTGDKMSDQKDASASIEFEGTGFILVGMYHKMAEAGTAEVYLDDQPPLVIDSSSDEDDPKGGESLYHRFDLEPGKHKVRVVILGKPYLEAKEAKVTLRDLVVFRK